MGSTTGAASKRNVDASTEKTWQRLVDPVLRNGQRFEESARTDKKEVARDKLRDIEGAIAKGVPVTPQAGRLTFDDAAKDLETEYTVNGRKTLKHLKRRFKKHLTLWFGGKPPVLARGEGRPVAREAVHPDACGAQHTAWVFQAGADCQRPDASTGGASATPDVRVPDGLAPDE
jgi:hypothetical protein